MVEPTNSKQASFPDNASWARCRKCFIHLRGGIAICQSFLLIFYFFLPGWDDFRPFKLLTKLPNWEKTSPDIFFLLGIAGHQIRCWTKNNSFSKDRWNKQSDTPADNHISVFLVWGGRRVFLIVGTDTGLHLSVKGYFFSTCQLSACAEQIK